jgi:TonB family protein
MFDCEHYYLKFKSTYFVKYYISNKYNFGTIVDIRINISEYLIYNLNFSFMKTNLKIVFTIAIASVLFSSKSFGGTYVSNESGASESDGIRPEYNASDTGDVANATEASEYNYSMPQPASGISLYNLLEDKIKYPALAYENEIQGSVKVLCTVETNGSVSSVKVLESADPKLSDAVISKVRDVIFKPAMQNGFPVRHSLVIPVTFKLL